MGKGVDYLDIALNLEDGSYKPYRKDNSVPKYINVGSNHPKCILNQIPKMVNDRISMLSSDAKSFDGAKDIYQNALNNAGHKYQMKYMPPLDQIAVRKNRKRNIC